MAAMHTAAAERLPEFVNSLVDIGVRRITERVPRLPPDAAHQVMRAVAADLVARYRSAEIYVPAGLPGQRVARDARIREAYLQPGAGGTPARSAARIRELAAEHSLSPRRVRAIVAAAGIPT